MWRRVYCIGRASPYRAACLPPKHAYHAAGLPGISSIRCPQRQVEFCDIHTVIQFLQQSPAKLAVAAVFCKWAQASGRLNPPELQPQRTVWSTSGAKGFGFDKRQFQHHPVTIEP
jgi:hypothetical protein